MMKLQRGCLPWLVAGLLALTAQSARAGTDAPYLMWCELCNVQQQSAIAALLPAGSTIYFADPSRDSVDAYLVRQLVVGTDAARRGDRVLPVVASPGYRDTILAAMRYYNQAPIGWHKQFARNVDAGLMTTDTLPVSAYQVSNAGRWQNLLTDALQVHDNDPALTKLYARVKRELTTFRLINPFSQPRMELKLTFSDSSHVEAQVDVAAARWKLDPDSARDAVGNYVPYIDSDGRLRNLGAQYEFAADAAGESARQTFLQQLHRMDVTVAGADGTSGEPGANDWFCRWRQREAIEYICSRRTGS